MYCCPRGRHRRPTCVVAIIGLIFIAGQLSCVAGRPTHTAGVEVDTTGYSLESDPLVELANYDPRIHVYLPYATKMNFMSKAVYPTERCFVRTSVAVRLSRVQSRLERRGYGLKVLDGYRPLAVQREMWRVLPDPTFVADPKKGSRHNRGYAVDVTLVDNQGIDVQMPTEFDDFSEAAGKRFPGGTAVSRLNRDLLIEVMEAEGFTGLDAEWWHFDAPGWKGKPLLDIPFDACE